MYKNSKNRILYNNNNKMALIIWATGIRFLVPENIMNIL